MVADGQLSDARYERLRVADRTGDYVWAEEAQPTPGSAFFQAMFLSWLHSVEGLESLATPELSEPRDCVQSAPFVPADRLMQPTRTSKPIRNRMRWSPGEEMKNREEV